MALKLLVVGIMAVLAVMIFTALIHVTAPYIAALLVLVPVGWILLKLCGDVDIPGPEKPPE